MENADGARIQRYGSYYESAGHFEVSFPPMKTTFH